MQPCPLVALDPYLKPFNNQIVKRMQRAVLRRLEFTDGNKNLSDCCNNYLYYGLHRTEKGWIFREKAPNAKAIYLIGEFSYWQAQPQYALTRIGTGDWEIELPTDFLRHGSLYKLWMVWQSGADERLPAYTTRAVQDPESNIFSAQVWHPKPYQWKNETPPKPAHPIIYEAHIGMSSSEPKVSSYAEFREGMLPRIKALGYNTLQLMAIQEHPYYGSFGYQVSNFYAPSSRFGTPEELKEMIDEAHHLGIFVILDLVHSHAVINEKEGLSKFDGSDNLYFHHGDRGLHPVWDSRCFDYGKSETISFLLSNVKYWMEEFHFDGFRFDGVTSMCYHHHGLGIDFVNYAQYFDDQVDEDAVCYLTLANQLVHEINNQAFTIAEDVSGMPGMAFPLAQGGIGFDYRMSMGIADFWNKSIKEKSDEKWSPDEIFHRLTDKRSEEETIGYAESHDQAMVGDKTIIFQLIDKEMYYSMAIDSHNLLVDRGIALHKLIRLATLMLSQGGYLNFMGNEFGHPEWIDFPREGNGWSYQYARRNWHLINPTLKYYPLNEFDKAMMHLIQEYHPLDEPIRKGTTHNTDQILSFSRGKLLFVFNFSPTRSFTDYAIHADAGEYRTVLNSDSTLYGGFNRIDEKLSYFTFSHHNDHFVKMYLPARSAIVLLCTSSV
ncbi:MAG: alpha amylase C-terminal domain-containing protein [Bacteroidales bacterium]|jgi:1,4-alpha-glucan branching enzyme|nr:alpha amylase C-terminal domain-containing protein [Bacteroidales bacterium]